MCICNTGLLSCTNQHACSRRVHVTLAPPSCTHTHTHASLHTLLALHSALTSVSAAVGRFNSMEMGREGVRGGVSLTLPDLLMTLTPGEGGGAALHALTPSTPVIPVARRWQSMEALGVSRQRLLHNEVGHVAASAAALFHRRDFRLQGSPRLHDLLMRSEQNDLHCRLAEGQSGYQTPSI